MRLFRRQVYVAALCAFAAGVLLAQTKQEDAGEQVFDLGDGITPPRLVHQVMPRHVKGSQGFRVGGVVVVGLVVTSKGLPKDVHVVKSLDKEVDQSAVDAVREWRFDPAKKDDKPVAVNVSVEIRFHDM